MAVTKAQLLSLSSEEVALADRAEGVIDNYLSTYYRGQKSDKITLPFFVSDRVVSEVQSRYVDSGFKMSFHTDTRVSGTVVEVR